MPFPFRNVKFGMELEPTKAQYMWRKDPIAESPGEKSTSLPRVIVIKSRSLGAFFIGPESCHHHVKKARYESDIVVSSYDAVGCSCVFGIHLAFYAKLDPERICLSSLGWNSAGRSILTIDCE